MFNESEFLKVVLKCKVFSFLLVAEVLKYKKTDYIEAFLNSVQIHWRKVIKIIGNFIISVTVIYKPCQKTSYPFFLKSKYS